MESLIATSSSQVCLSDEKEHQEASKRKRSIPLSDEEQEEPREYAVNSIDEHYEEEDGSFFFLAHYEGDEEPMWKDAWEFFSYDDEGQWVTEALQTYCFEHPEINYEALQTQHSREYMERRVNEASYT